MRDRTASIGSIADNRFVRGVFGKEGIKGLIAEVPDYPKPGIVFKDVTPVLAHRGAFESTVEMMSTEIEETVGHVDLIVGAEARGFILGPAIAYKLHAGFIPARKPGKLPREVHSVEYALEYGVDTLQMHRDSIRPGQRVVIHDDLLATGGTAGAIAKMVTDLGGEVVAYSFIVELTYLQGRLKLPAGPPVLSLVSYDD